MGYGNVAPAPVMVCADAEIDIAVSKIANNCFTRSLLVRQLFRPICVTILLQIITVDRALVCMPDNTLLQVLDQNRPTLTTDTMPVCFVTSLILI